MNFELQNLLRVTFLTSPSQRTAATIMSDGVLPVPMDVIIRASEMT